MIKRPFDLLSESINKNISIRLKSEKKFIYAKLISFDIHLNLVIKEEKLIKFIRGDEVISISREEKNGNN